MMSQENVEVVRRIYEAAESRDAATVFSLYDSDVVLDASRLGMFSRPFRGHAGLKRLFADWHDAWGEIEYSYDELTEAGDQVVAVVSRHATGRSSGLEVAQRFALLWTLRDGKVVRVVWYLSPHEALEAAGRSE